MWVTLEGQPPGDAGTFMTVSRMSALIRKESAFPIVRRLAQRIVAHVGGRDVAGQAEALRSWLNANFRFIRDPVGTELLHTPEFLLRDFDRYGYIQGDCDDAAVLAGALARAVGMRVRIIVAGFTNAKGPYQHVWAEVAPPAGNWWREMDVTRSVPDLEARIVKKAVREV